MWNASAWSQERWKSCSNGSYFNIVALCFGDHGTKEMSGVVAQQLPTTRDNMQQGVQTDATCNIQQCSELLANNVAFCCILLDVVAQSSKPVKLFSQQLPTLILSRDRRSVVQQCWIRLHSSSNIVGATNAHYAWSTKRYGLYPSHDALQVPTLLGVVASVCTQPYK